MHQLTVLASLVEAKCYPAGSDITGELSSGHLTLSGRLFTTQFSGPKRGSFNYILDEFDHSDYLGKYKLFSDILLHENQQPGLELHCLEIGRIQKAGKIVRENKYYLVLEKSKIERGAYERVGLLSTCDEPLIAEWQARSRVAVVKIM